VTNGEVIEIYGSGINEGQEIIVNPNDKLQNRIIGIFLSKQIL